MSGIFARKEGRESRFAKLSFLSASGEAGANPFKSADEDHRIAPRHEVSADALIVHPDFSRVLACRVDDVSDTGARLRSRNASSCRANSGWSPRMPASPTARPRPGGVFRKLVCH